MAGRRGEEGYQGGREGGRGTLGGNDSRFCSEFFTQVLTKVTVCRGYRGISVHIDGDTGQENCGGTIQNIKVEPDKIMYCNV